MKKIFIFGSVATLVVGLNFRASTSSSTPPVGYTGAPGQSNCTSCHSGAANSGSGSVTLLGAPSAYVPGTTYVIQVKVTDASKSRFGFEMLALNGSNQQAGTFSLISTANTALQTSGGKTYASHKNANSTNLWSINWQAPATNVGPVTFYLAGNAANGNSTDTGDLIYTNSLVLSPTSTAGIQEENMANVNFFPNPASEKATLNLAEKAKVLKILDITGKEVFRNDAVENTNQLDVSKYPNGTYFLQVEQEKTMQLKRFVVQH